MMRRASASFGVNSDTIPTIEATYLEFLALLNAHLAHAPYLMGGHATIADYSLMAPLYAHLARDPFPATLMKQHAPRVWRWVERMNTGERYAGEYLGAPETLFDPASIPETLMALLRFIAADYLPEVEAFVAGANAWLDARADIPPGALTITPPTARAIGMVPCDWRGHAIQVGILPYRLWLLQKVQAAADAAPALLEATGLAGLRAARVRRIVRREAHLEYWAEFNPQG